jgi:RNA polymerase primary sigma factor
LITVEEPDEITAEEPDEITAEEPDEITAEEPDEADLDTGADPGDFGGLDADDADLQATLTVLAVLADDIGDDSEVADDLAGDTGDLIGDADDLIGDTDVLAGDADDLAGDAGEPEVPDGPEDRAAPAKGKPPAEAGGEDEEVLVFSDDDEDLPAARVAIAGATADPVKDYLKQIGKVPLLNAEQEVELAKRIEAGLFAEEKLAQSGMTPDQRLDMEWIAEDGRRARQRSPRSMQAITVRACAAPVEDGAGDVPSQTDR